MFIQNLRAKIGARLSGEGESGFTLIELLVVMLILGILAAIAIPAFFSQRDKANDAQAKAMARTAQTAMETYGTDHGGKYTDVEPADLIAIEDTLGAAPETGKTADGPYVSLAEADNGTGYKITITSPETENTFSINRDDESGAVSFPCTVPTGNDPGGCTNTTNWAG